MIVPESSHNYPRIGMVKTRSRKVAPESEADYIPQSFPGFHLFYDKKMSHNYPIIP
jgi:hypothetical protein